jgi:hypothetical protein
VPSPREPSRGLVFPVGGGHAGQQGGRYPGDKRERERERRQLALFYTFVLGRTTPPPPPSLSCLPAGNRSIVQSIGDEDALPGVVNGSGAGAGVPLVPRELCRLSGAFANGGRGALSGSAHACWMCV